MNPCTIRRSTFHHQPLLQYTHKHQAVIYALNNTFAGVNWRAMRKVKYSRSNNPKQGAAERRAAMRQPCGSHATAKPWRKTRFANKLTKAVLGHPHSVFPKGSYRSGNVPSTLSFLKGSAWDGMTRSVAPRRVVRRECNAFE